MATEFGPFSYLPQWSLSRIPSVRHLFISLFAFSSSFIPLQLKQNERLRCASAALHVTYPFLPGSFSRIYDSAISTLKAETFSSHKVAGRPVTPVFLFTLNSSLRLLLLSAVKRLKRRARLVPLPPIGGRVQGVPSYRYSCRFEAFFCHFFSPPFHPV